MTACGTTTDRVPDPEVVFRERLVAVVPDEALRTCKARPAKPALRDDADTAVLIVDLDERGQDCASKLAATWRSIDDAVRRAEAANGREPGD